MRPMTNDQYIEDDTTGSSQPHPLVNCNENQSCSTRRLYQVSRFSRPCRGATSGFILIALASLNFMLFIQLLNPRQIEKTTSVYYFFIQPSSNLSTYNNQPHNHEFTGETTEYSRRTLSNEAVLRSNLSSRQNDTIKYEKKQHEQHRQDIMEKQIQEKQTVHSDNNLNWEHARDSNASSLMLPSLMSSIQKQAHRAVHIIQKIEPDIKLLRLINHSAIGSLQRQQQQQQTERQGRMQQPQKQQPQKQQDTAGTLKKPETKKVNDKKKINSIFYQKMWTRNDIVKLLDTPECSAAIANAKKRMPRNVAICPLCTAGIVADTIPFPIQYMKIPKAGSSTMVKYLTNQSQRSNYAKTLCIDQPVSDVRYTIVRDPLERVYSAYREVDSKTKQWMYSPNVTYRQWPITTKQNQTRRFLQFLKDYYNGYMESWDAGMPHHMVGAALHLDALRTESDGITKNNIFLPDLVGRLEYINDFITKMRQVIRKVYNLRTNTRSINDNNTASGDGDTSEEELEAVYARNYGASGGLDVGMEWIVEKLFEEDFVCFGYPMRSKNLTTYKQLSRRKLQRANENYQLSKSYFPYRVLKQIGQNHKRHNITAPSCASHYTGNKRKKHPIQST